MIVKRKYHSMGQSQSMEGSDKDMGSNTGDTDIIIPPTHTEQANNNTTSEVVKKRETSTDYRSSSFDNEELFLNSPLMAFLSGFYQKSNPMGHVFFQLSFDDVCRIAEYAKNWKVLPYTGQPNDFGIIHWIGCLNETHSYTNPIKQEMIKVLTGRDYHVNYSRNEANVYRILEYPCLTDKDCYFDPGCIIFHFPNHMINPTGYAYRNGGGRGSVVRKWVLEASNDVNGPWITISTHPEDDTYFYDVTDGQNKENSFLTHCWPIDTPQGSKDFYSYFKLQSMHTHPNGRAHALYISGFELYGVIRWNRK